MRTRLHVWVILAVLASATQPVRGQQPPAPQDTGVPAAAAPDAVATSGTTGAPVVSETLALQVMLDRAGFSPGEIDGKAGPNVKRALAAFQRAQGVAPSGDLEEDTWARLRAATGDVPPLSQYDITSADTDGPFTAAIPADLVAQSKLGALGYRTPLEALGEKFHASPRLLQELNPGVSFAAGERIVVPNVVDAASATSGADTTSGAAQAAAAQPRVTIVVSKQTSALTVEDEGGRVLFHAPVTSGSERDPLPIGRWKVTGVQWNPVFHYNPDLFWDADPTHSKARIPPGPNNPVGVAWIDISKEHYGIHGTPEPSRVGHVQSHGCIRLTNWDVRRVAQWARPGTTVVFR